MCSYCISWSYIWFLFLCSFAMEKRPALVFLGAVGLLLVCGAGGVCARSGRLFAVRCAESVPCRGCFNICSLAFSRRGGSSPQTKLFSSTFRITLILNEGKHKVYVCLGIGGGRGETEIIRPSSQTSHFNLSTIASVTKQI